MIKRKRYYFIGIGGIAMGTLAGMLKSKGHVVAGSDTNVFPPMSDILKRQKIKVFTPYKALHVKHFKPDKIVIGNTIKQNNPELEYVVTHETQYLSLPEAIRDEIIKNKKSIVITGTHGKTTTTAILGWILKYAGKDPTIFNGGFMRNINSTFEIGGSEHVVIEGDEYNTSFKDKNSKFLYYKPHIGVINNIEHDHVNIFPTIKSVKNAFSKFAKIIPQNGLLVVNADNKHVIDVSSETLSPIITFGIKKGDLRASNIEFDKETSFNVLHKKHSLGTFLVKLPGRHNVYNAIAAISVAKYLGISTNKIKQALATFEGVSRRSEILGEKNGKVVINDFAHHPTAIRETLDGLRNMFHGKRLIVLFELASSSSKMKIMEKPIIKSLKLADIAYVYNSGELKSFTKAKLSSKFNVSHNLENLLFHLKHDSKPGDIIVMMSSKGFDGLKDKIWGFI